MYSDCSMSLRSLLLLLLAPPPPDDATLEDLIVQSCLLCCASPSEPLQQAVSQLISLVQAHPVVAVTGPSGSGKSVCIEVAATAARELTTPPSLTRLAPGAMAEEELFGFEREEDK